jgi:hypothetical protein
MLFQHRTRVQVVGLTALTPIHCQSAPACLTEHTPLGPSRHRTWGISVRSGGNTAPPTLCSHRDQAHPLLEIPWPIVYPTRTLSRVEPKPILRLPAPTTRLICREAELKVIARILLDPSCRLLTLLGPGGIGKTRLALAAAREQAHLF